MVFARPALRQEDFDSLRALIKEVAGIQLADSKHELVASRLARRLRFHRYSSYAEYCRHIESRDPQGSELRELINCITTNKTDFFREAHHFDFLARNVLRKEQHELSIWSAGCSTGEEPYSIAMTAREELGTAASRRVRILATDIDTQVLARARAGIYDEARACDIPDELRPKYLLRGSGARAGTIRMRREVADMVTFAQLNLNGAWPELDPFDVIFCRNVIIYFDAATRNRLMERFAAQLRPGGYLLLGHSESLHDQQRWFEPMGKTVYRMRNRATTAAVIAAPERPVKPAVPHAATRRHAAGATTIIAGAWHVASTSALIRTILGSCVAACLFDETAGVGGMNHFMLPFAPDEENCARYGVNAMELLINEIMRQGGSRRRIKAKAFGAATMLDNTPSIDVPAFNARFIREFLAAEGIPLVAEKLGGVSPLEVRMHAPDGKVWVRAIDRERASSSLSQESRYNDELATAVRQKLAGQITLF